MDTRIHKVQILQGHNDLALIQWEDAEGIRRRNWVAQDKLQNITGRNAEVENPSSGFPYGVDFWRLVKLKADPKVLDTELKNRGIWTAADVRARPNEVISALMATYGIDLSALLQALEEYEKALSTEA